jgi:F-type H+-transporting ATPase subunit b
MPRKTQILIILAIVPFFLFFTAAEEKAHASNSSDFLGKVVNFIVLFGGLSYFLYKPLLSYLEKKSSDVRQSLEDAEVSRREAERKLQEATQRLSRLEEEVTKIKMEAELEGGREKERIKVLAQQEAERLRRFAQLEIEMQVKAGIQELKEYTAELAASLALGRIRRKLTPEDHSLLIDKSLERLAKLYEKSNPS